MMEFEEWKTDLLKYFGRQIDIWTQHFVKDKIEEIKIFIRDDANGYIGMELLQKGIWYQLCFSNDDWQTEHLENAPYQLRDAIKGSCFLDELWFYFCEEAGDEEKSSMKSVVVTELQKRYDCRVTAINERIQLRLI